MAEQIAYSIPSAAKEFEVGVNTIREAIERNELVVHYISERNPRIAHKELTRWFEGRPTERPTGGA